MTAVTQRGPVEGAGKARLPPSEGEVGPQEILLQAVATAGLSPPPPALG